MVDGWIHINIQVNHNSSLFIAFQVARFYALLVMGKKKQTSFLKSGKNVKAKGTGKLGSKNQPQY